MEKLDKSNFHIAKSRGGTDYGDCGLYGLDRLLALSFVKKIYLDPTPLSAPEFSLLSSGSIVQFSNLVHFYGCLEVTSC